MINIAIDSFLVQKLFGLYTGCVILNVVVKV